jgi:sodium/hydrogen exchanger 10/11
MIFQFIQYYKEMNQDFENWDYLSLFFEYTIGGIIFGVVAGSIAVYCIKRMIYDGPLAVTLMVIFTYSIYLIAEYSTFRISGIISLSAFSLYMNAFGKTWLFGETEEYASSFWNYLVFVAETSIFMIAGVLVGANIMQFEEGEINIGKEAEITVYIYLTALLCRFCSIGVFIRYLRRLGEGMAWSEVVVLTFAGLKGAIGIALAMHVYNNHHYGKVVSGLILFHVTTNSLITLILHGLGTNFIVRALGISSLKRVEYKFFQEYLYSFEVSIL